MPVKIQENISMAPFTFYKIGGPARYFFEAKNSDSLAEALAWANNSKIPFFILGAGSNVLVSDRGFRGLVIRLNGGEIKVEGERIIVDAGVMMARAATEAAQAGLSGFEWAIGVPGTIGGSVRGNAGCFGGEMEQVLERVKILEISSPKSEILNKSKIKNTKTQPQELTSTECKFGYRDSIFKKYPEFIVLSATLKLRRDGFPKIQERIKLLSAERTQKQDIGTKSCGCIFKNVSWNRKYIDKNAVLANFPELRRFADKENIPASYLIDAAGLKDKRIGRVFVSPKHANFFINDGGATAEEVVMLISLVKDAVRRKFGVLLEEEIQYVGF